MTMEWHHTWSIHPVMTTSSTLHNVTNSGIQLDNEKDALRIKVRETSSSDIKLSSAAESSSKKRPLRYVTNSNLFLIPRHELELSATDHLRRYTTQRKQCRMQLRSTKSVKHNSKSNQEGDSVRILWTSSNKNSNHEVDDKTSERHLYIDARLQNVFSAAVIFCYYKNDNESVDDKPTVGSFDFCLARGLRSSYETLFSWIATLSDGMLYVGMTPFQFNTNDLTSLLSSWITMEYHHLRSIGCIKTNLIGNDGTDEPTNSFLKKYTKSSLNHIIGNDATSSLVLTFKTPNTITSAGLDTISLTVPSRSLWEMYSDICGNKPECLIESQQSLPTTIPIVQAIQCVIDEAFGIDVSTFVLIKIATTFAILGSDGQYTPTEKPLLHNPITLPELRRWIERAKGISIPNRQNAE
jgi:hypothetical protein